MGRPDHLLWQQRPGQRLPMGGLRLSSMRIELLDFRLRRSFGFRTLAVAAFCRNNGSCKQLTRRNE
jgi:hypothetical protein